MPLPMRERDLQRLIVDYLEVQHYIVLELSAWRRRTTCPACGHAFHPRGGSSSPGAPDMLLWHPLASPGGGHGMLGLEVKLPGSRSRLSPAQRELVTLGVTRVVRSLEEVEQVLLECGMPVSIGGLR